MVLLSAWPFNAGDGSVPSEDRWTEQAQFYLTDGVVPHRSTDVFTTGMSDEMVPFGDSSGMQVKVRTGRLFIKGHFGKLSTQTTLPLSAAHATLGRIDLVIGRLDKSNNLIEVVILEGTPSVSPAAPSLTQNDTTYEITLATVTVDAAATTIAAGKVVPAYPWARPRGLGISGKIGNSANTFTGVGIKSSAHPAQGQYTAVFTEDMGTDCGVLAGCVKTSFAQAVVHAFTGTTIEIRTYDAGGSALDVDWATFQVTRGDI